MLFTFTAEDETSHLSMEVEAASLGNIFMFFENFLLGAGFVMNGHIDLVDSCDCCKTESEEIFPDTYDALDNLKIRFEKSE